ncbi:MAG: acyltransferase [Novosphingobium sp.]
MKMPEIEKQRLIELEVLRGFLACWVVGYHIMTDSALPVAAAIVRVVDGAHAVNTFIILSGFVICTLRLNKAEPYRIFLFRRFCRLFPAYAVAVAAAIALAFLGVMDKKFANSDLPILLLSHATLIQGVLPNWVVPDPMHAFLYPTWSLTLEWQFYLIAPAMIATMMKNRFWFAVVTVVVFVISRFLPPYIEEFGLTRSFILSMLQLFWVGIASALIFDAIPRPFPPIAGWIAIAMVGALILLLPIQPNIGTIVWGIVFAAMILHRTEPVGRFGRLLDWLLARKSLIWLGLISYSIYLIHEPLIRTVRWLVLQADPAASPKVVFVAALIAVPPLTLGFAHLIYRFVERPAMRWGACVAANYGSSSAPRRIDRLASDGLLPK